MILYGFSYRNHIGGICSSNGVGCVACVDAHFSYLSGELLTSNYFVSSLLLSFSGYYFVILEVFGVRS